MDPERVPALPQSEITSPDHALNENPSGTIQMDLVNPSHPNVPQTTARIDTSNLNPSAAKALTSSSYESLEAVQSPLPVHLPESSSGKRETRINNDNQFPNTMTQVQNEIDWIVPTQDVGKHTIAIRMEPTLATAITEKNIHATYARWAGRALNTAIGLQVLLGSLTTGLSALAVSGGHSTAAATTALGAIATLVASFLARARGSGEPELSSARAKALDQFIRKCRAFIMDHGHITGSGLDKELIDLRNELEEILGNTKEQKQ